MREFFFEFVGAERAERGAVAFRAPGRDERYIRESVSIHGLNIMRPRYMPCYAVGPW